MLGRRRAVLSRVIDWYRGLGQSRRDHIAAWAGWDIPGPSGLSRFQEECEAALSASLVKRGLTLEEREIRSMPDEYIHGRVQGVWEVWIYLDQAQVVGPKGAGANREKWDAKSPSELIQDFIARMEREMDRVGAQ